ncbi:hypothetical protein [Amycolatopsis sp. YIM 10]|uniref:hypothetical protein n=1 Tax=Amycolatopsis sp. YIM 10 TaxID=2653857 RepID=UPI0012903F87|nr:hypothetical protein [Amycolatopsis sp. YIM 10]QFU91263.1 hypothetical protein YIM_30485 [Amycolatopsis sp. YIM 10]
MSSEQAVIVTYALPVEGFPGPVELNRVSQLERELEEATGRGDLGELDGHEYGGGQVQLFLYGQDARRLFTAIEPLLRGFPYGPGRAVVRLGEPGASEFVVEL